MVSAESVRSVWRTTFDPKDKVKDATAEFGITGSDIYLADQHTMTFERRLIELFANFSDELAKEDDMDFDLLYSTPRRSVVCCLSSSLAGDERFHSVGVVEQDLMAEMECSCKLFQVMR